MVRVGREEAIEWGRRFRASGAIELVRLDQELEEDAWEILERHGDKRWSYVDATSFALIERDGGGEAFAFDAHFGQRGLRVLPERLMSGVSARPSRDRLAPMPASRSYDRAPADIRPVTIDPGFVATADGSALISIGKTRVICTASVNESVPRWMQGRGKGWVTAEYAMLPASTGDRKAARRLQGQAGRARGGDPAPDRPLAAGRRRLRGAGRTQRLRRLRRARRPTAAPAARRSPAATSPCAWRFQKLLDARAIETMPLNGSVAAVSVGMVDGRALCDLDYGEDSSAEVDANVVMTGDGGLVEVQATAERTPLSRASLDELLGLAEHGNRAPAPGAGAGQRAT